MENALNISAVGQSLRHFRELRGLTLEQLADRVGCHHSTIWRAEAGTNPLEFERLAGICAGLDVSILTVLAHAAGGAPPQAPPLSPTETALLEDWSLLLEDDQQRIASEIAKLANVARAYRAKFGGKHADNDRVAKALPLPPTTTTTEKEKR